ncbi:hypothetical protein [Nocardioides convexus]|uniref:hypothetical protein n=1 Tax=Nocardioides convexus TaxID=2712224 RepID=UPI0024184740|nr:hypothetical protein [Nocardioides convexus]
MSLRSNRVIDARTGEALAWDELPAVSAPAPAAVVVPTSYDALPWVHRHVTTGDESARRRGRPHGAGAAPGACWTPASTWSRATPSPPRPRRASPPRAGSGC